jgi:intracellular sulfur oxidation DsrE/DsrF family protein
MVTCPGSNFLYFIRGKIVTSVKLKIFTMKRNLMIAVLLLASPFSMNAQNANYKVVFDLTSKDSLDHKSVIRWLTEIANANPEAKLEVVMYGQGFNMVTKDRSVVSNAIPGLVKNKNISFKVCEIALKNNNVDKSQLLPGIETVPDGIYEIISKQREGWGYIKAAH